MSHNKLNTPSSNSEKEEKPSIKERIASGLAVTAFLATSLASSPGSSLRNPIEFFRGNNEDKTIQLVEAEHYDEYVTIIADFEGTRYSAVRQVYPDADDRTVFDLVWSTINQTAIEEGRDDKHDVEIGDRVDVPKIDFEIVD